MITYEEEQAVKLSATKKDFYQLWNELLETAQKISERWDPASTNESDPGIVLLKVLTAVADKLNYEIDVNALEAFMPSAAQEESMRKLTEMLGYTMKYYQSATTNAQISYNKNTDSPISGTVYLDKFTNLKDIDDSVNYVTLQEAYFTSEMTTRIVPCIEGELVVCETDDDNIVSMLQLDDNNRYFLPELQIAENGIFITSLNDGNESEPWVKVSNLNTQIIGTKCYKFGFDSKMGLPYVQFPTDISTIIEDGLRIKYIRTSGINGNISPKTLSKMEKPASWVAALDTSIDYNAEYYNNSNYSVTNIAAAKNGANAETLTNAYNSYKKIIGTFDTLVTCRDYMNKIYQMTIDEIDTTPLVSNIVVSDIRDDINKAITMCTFGDYGIEYNNISKTFDFANTIEYSKDNWNSASRPQPSAANFNKVYKIYDGDRSNVIAYYKCIYDGNNYKYVSLNTEKINHFDLMLYPFKPVYGLNSKAEYVNSFKYTASNIGDIKTKLDENKTLSHNFVLPNPDDIVCIKNYYKLDAKIITNRKINALEQLDILSNVYTEIYKNFNARQVDFGEELSYDAILKVIEEADPRIKSVSLDDPTINTKFCTADGEEYSAGPGSSVSSDPFVNAGNIYFNKLALNNILAGRISLFNYNENFKPSFTETEYPSWEENNQTKKYELIYPTVKDSTTQERYKLEHIESSFTIEAGAKGVKLNPNEVIQFRLPNLRTERTYPAYVNYFIKLNGNAAANTKAVPATMQSLWDYLMYPKSSANPDPSVPIGSRWESAINYIASRIGETNSGIYKATEIVDSDTFIDCEKNVGAIFKKVTDRFVYCSSYDSNIQDYYYVVLSDANYSSWNAWVKTIPTVYDSDVKLEGLYTAKAANLNKSFGLLVDNKHKQYIAAQSFTNHGSTKANLENYFIQVTHANDKLPDENTAVEDSWLKTGLGQDAILNGIKKDEEYQLKEDEYLLINFTHSTSTEGEEKKTVENICYVPGDIIKPNFELIDSMDYRTKHSYSKISGFDFSAYASYTNFPEVTGMFTLGTNEQIEIREFATIDLDSPTTNLYWERNDEVVGYNDRIYFIFDEEYDSASEKYLAYTLKEGEYLYYTNKDKTDMAYYGSGTKIRRTKDTPEIYKSSHDTVITAEEIAAGGLTAAIPWRSYDLEDDNKLVIQEYQYINLTAGDKLETLGTSSQRTAEDIEVKLETNPDSPVYCTNATYTLNGIVESLPPVNISGIYWEVSTKFELNMGPAITQKLYSLDDYCKDTLKLYYLEKDSHQNPITVTIEPKNHITVSVKSNKIIQSTRFSTDVSTVKLSDTGSVISRTYDCELKIFNSDTLKDSNNTTVNLYNYGDGNYTKITFAEVDTTLKGTPYLTLNVLLPENHFGLLLVQNNKLSAGKNASIRLIRSTPVKHTPASTDNSIPGPVIYNNNDAWWDSGETRNTWAIEGKYYGSISQALYASLADTLYVRTVVTKPENPCQLYRYDDITQKCYRYQKATGWQTASEYCQLLDVGYGPSTGSAQKYYELRKCINIVKISQSCKIQIFPDEENKDVVIFGNIDVIPTNNPINPKLEYKVISGSSHSSVEEQVLADIKKLDPDNKFYYNAVINNEIAVDLNDNDNTDTLDNPLNWYNYNNINNKFVISEIDAEYLSTGITIAKNSKL